MKIETNLLKELVNKAINGVGNNKLIPITQLMCIEKLDNHITLITTDATNYLYVFGEIPSEQDDLTVTVFADQFAKLISKITSDVIALDVIDNTLIISGNGKYSLELPLGEDGELVVYPNPIEDFDGLKQSGTIDFSDIKTVLDAVKPSLATDMSNPVLTNYFVGNSIIATDRYKVASFNTRLFKDVCLISPELMDLLNTMSASTISYTINGDAILFSTDDIKIYGKLISDDYPVEVLEQLLNEKFPSTCKISKLDFLNLLDRMSLLVGKYDNKSVRMSFKKNAIDISNMANKSNEAVEYISVSKYKEFDCVVDIDMLITQIKAYTKDTVELHFGKENALKLVDNNITQLVALNDNK